MSNKIIIHKDQVILTFWSVTQQIAQQPDLLINGEVNYKILMLS